MFFNESSALVQLYIKNIRDDNNPMTREDVPALLNLRDVVYSILDTQ